jgi:hypothetical protein
MEQLEIRCIDCKHLLIDRDMETETIACEQGYFNYTLYPDETPKDYVNIEDGSCPCKGKKFVSVFKSK